MKYLINILATVAVGWPALVLGYLWAAFASGFSTGGFLHQRHKDAAIAKFVHKGKP